MVKERYQAVLAVIGDGLSISQVAGKVGVSRQTLHTWLVRYEAQGLDGLTIGRTGRCRVRIRRAVRRDSAGRSSQPTRSPDSRASAAHAVAAEAGRPLCRSVWASRWTDAASISRAPATVRVTVNSPARAMRPTCRSETRRCSAALEVVISRIHKWSPIRPIKIITAGNRIESEAGVRCQVGSMV